VFILDRDIILDFAVYAPFFGCHHQPGKTRLGNDLFSVQWDVELYYYCYHCTNVSNKLQLN